MWCHFLSLRAEWIEVTVEIQKHIVYELGDLNAYQYLASTTEEEHKGNKNAAGNFCQLTVQLCASREERVRVHFNQRWRKMPESRGRRELVFKDKDCSVIWLHATVLQTLSHADSDLKLTLMENPHIHLYPCYFQAQNSWEDLLFSLGWITTDVSIISSQLTLPRGKTQPCWS